VGVGDFLDGIDRDQLPIIHKSIVNESRFDIGILGAVITDSGYGTVARKIALGAAPTLSGLCSLEVERPEIAGASVFVASAAMKGDIVLHRLTAAVSGKIRHG